MAVVKAGDSLKITTKKNATGGKAQFLVSGALEVISLVMVDLLAFFGLLGLAYLSRMYLLPFFIPGLPQGISPATLLQISWFPLLAVLSFAFSGLYTRRCPWMQETGLLARASTFSLLVALATLFLLKESSQVSRLLILITWINCLWLVPMTRLFAKRCLISWGLWERPIIIVGSGKVAGRIYQALQSDSAIGYRVLGTVLPDKREKDEDTPVVPVLGDWGNIDSILARTGVRDVVIATTGPYSMDLGELVSLLQQRAENVLFVPDIYGLPVLGADIGYFFEQRTLVINFRNNLKNLFNIAAKRLFDILAGLLISAVALPFLAGLAAAVVIDSRGPVFYRQERVGRQGRVFWCYKFRTMVLDADSVLAKLINEDSQMALEWARDHKLKKDPRITRVGNFLRRFSLDELPQLINVLKGEMSLVGPRPVVQKEIQKYGSHADYYYTVRPGLSGL